MWSQSAVAAPLCRRTPYGGSIKVHSPLMALLFLAGCKGAPSINLVGSFFPAWMLCVAIGVFGVLILRRVFVRTQIEAHLGTLPLVYFCLWVLLTLGSWLLFFRG